jgi:hypothetical protein
MSGFVKQIISFTLSVAGPTLSADNSFDLLENETEDSQERF